jgi:hypothetical protein
MGYRWQPTDEPQIRPVNPPDLKPTETLLYDEPGRCGGLDSHSHHYRVVSEYGSLTLVVRHGGGDERISLYKPTLNALAALDSNARYWMLHAIDSAHGKGRREGQETETMRWRKAAAEKRIKTRKMPKSQTVKVWIDTPGVEGQRYW